MRWKNCAREELERYRAEFFHLVPSFFLFFLRVSIFFSAAFQDQQRCFLLSPAQQRNSGKASPRDQRAEAAGTMHNVIIPSGRIQNRPVRKSVALAYGRQLPVRRERGTARGAYNAGRVVERRKSACMPRGHSNAFPVGFRKGKTVATEGNCDKYLASRLTTLFPLINHAS